MKKRMEFPSGLEWRDLETLRKVARHGARSILGRPSLSRAYRKGVPSVAMFPGFASDENSLRALSDEVNALGLNVFHPSSLPRGPKAIFSDLPLEKQAQLGAEDIDGFLSEHSDATVYLFGPSNGGLVASLVKERYEKQNTTHTRQRVGRVITLATPHRVIDPKWATLPGVRRLNAAKHLRPHSSLHQKLIRSRKSLYCIVSEIDELFPPHAQYPEGAIVDYIDISHWGLVPEDDTLESLEPIRKVAAAIKRAISLELEGQDLELCAAE